MLSYRSFAVTGAYALFSAASVWLLPPLAFGQATPSSAESKASTGAVPTHTVISCNDGDTCRARATDGSIAKVRLVGIDAPEMTSKGGRKKGKGQPGGEEAKAFLNKLLEGKSVVVRSYGVDMYGRTLAEIMIDNQSANVLMISEGWAEVYRGKKPAGLDSAAMEAAEQTARRASRGIWSIPGYISPKEWRKKNHN